MKIKSSSELVENALKEVYFLAQGGTAEEASAAAYKACGSACDNY